MCGFTGFTKASEIAETDKVLTSMMERIVHRGPDSEGRYIDDDIAMGFRRLSIIDITDSGDQPIFNEDGSLVLMFNGEIYNYMELREELISKGHTFRTKTDSEVLVHGYEEYGEELLQKLRGMFAFIIWDKNKKELFGARDPFGIKPFYYAKFGKTLLFGSEIKSFLDHPTFRKGLNTAALENYLTFQYSPTNETFFRNVYKLMPAHFFRFDGELLFIKRYWDVHFSPDNSVDMDEWTDRISDVFKDSVEAHKIADVEVGSFLSSGVDSSYVASVANVDKTFTVGFGEDEKYNEIGWAKEFSKYIGKENKSKVISPDEYWNSIKTVQYHMDEPLADPSCIALYFVCKKAAEYVKVVLSGEGADEIFGGYNVYMEPLGSHRYKSLPMELRRAVGMAADKLPHVKGVNFLIRNGLTLEERFIGNAYIFTPAERRKLLRINTKAPEPTVITAPYYAKVKDMDEITRMQYLDLHLWMAGDILLKADKMSMANSLELRVPFLDKRVMELAEKIPTSCRVSTENTKLAMRNAARRAAPEKTAAKKKLGFPVPIRVWLKEDKYYNMVKKAFTSADAQKFFNTKELVKLLDDHRKGRFDNSRRIWTVFIFLQWYEVYFHEEN
ncbi:MAG: asparagine synthase (glutamine-hydrolyzing) [Oscillospiraceae bacterium]|nr:asparagine synthase (glutamine-hydrolyzing) [Oscillospiraceae bacterium]